MCDSVEEKQIVKGKTKTFKLLTQVCGKIEALDLGLQIQTWINTELKPKKIITVHITEIPDRSINIGGMYGKKAVVTVIHENSSSHSVSDKK